jgi:hypothetical protein
MCYPENLFVRERADKAVYQSKALFKRHIERRLFLFRYRLGRRSMRLLDSNALRVHGAEQSDGPVGRGKLQNCAQTGVTTSYASTDGAIEQLALQGPTVFKESLMPFARLAPDRVEGSRHGLPWPIHVQETAVTTIIGSRFFTSNPRLVRKHYSH